MGKRGIVDGKAGNCRWESGEGLKLVEVAEFKVGVPDGVIVSLGGC